MDAVTWVWVLEVLWGTSLRRAIGDLQHCHIRSVPSIDCAAAARRKQASGPTTVVESQAVQHVVGPTLFNGKMTRSSNGWRVGSLLEGAILTGR